MRGKRLGCITGFGEFAVVITLLAVGGFFLLTGGEMFSPGPLSAASGESLGGVQSHAEIGGRCELCHAPPWDAAGMDGRCSSCHTEIQAEQGNPAVLHTAFKERNPAFRCRDCHPEHRGSDAPLTFISEVDFPHDVLGFSLSGHAEMEGGAAFTCGDCHGEDVTSFDPAVCQDCHHEIEPEFTRTHVAWTGPTCLDCHDGVDTFGDDFDHSATQFVLTGLHAEVDCAECHPGTRAPADFQRAPADCFSCHEPDDPHEGVLGPDCATCHTTDGWLPAVFDHTTTGFDLIGEHASVECQECHGDKTFQETPTDCFSCHEADDTHQGQFGPECATCHTPEGWSPAVYDHSQTDFPLTGAHAAVECSGCHTSQSGPAQDTPTDCVACHSADDAHQGSFGPQCASCHTTEAWLPATFDHNQTSFPLTGAHASVTCQSCHAGGGAQAQNTPTDCFACHSSDDAHQGRFGTSCSACHSVNGWLPASFDHNLSGFPLTGAHAGVACESCHSGGRFQGTPSQCSGCHADPAIHAGLFGGSCSDCHTVSAWRPASFNLPHTFPMGHGNASTCRDCHPSALTSWTCFTCHSQGEVVDEHDEPLDTLGNCLRCHPTGDEDEGGGDDDDD